MWNPRKDSIDANSKSLSTTKESTENEMDSQFLQETPRSGPQSSEEWPLLFQRGMALFGASFSSIHGDGAAGIDEVVLLQTQRQKTNTSSQKLQGSEYSAIMCMTSFTKCKIETTLLANFIASMKSSKREACGRTNPCLENNDRRRMNKYGVLSQDERRAHYAANWIKANKMFQETYDNLDQKDSMENRNSIEEAQDSLHRSLSENNASSENYKTQVHPSGSSSDFEIVLDEDSPKQQDSESITPVKQSLNEAASSPKDLQDENSSLKLSLSQLQRELAESKSDANRANARVSTLVSDLASANRQLSENLGKSSINKKDLTSKSQNSTQTGLSRQQSAYSEYCDGASKKSMISNISGVASNRSSLKSFVSRTSSIAAVQDRELKNTQSLSKTDEFEAERLAFAEKLVQKEEVIAKLQTQVDFSTAQLRQLEAGIDGLETRFTREINIFKTESTKRYESMIEQSLELISAGTVSKKGLKDLKQEFQKLTVTVRKQVRDLEKEIASSSGVNKTLEEKIKSLESDLEVKIQMLDEAEKQSTRLIHELEVKASENEGQTQRVHHLEDLLAEVKGELAEFKSRDLEHRGHLEELRSLNERASGLEAGLAEYESQNQDLFRQLEHAQRKLEMRDADALEQMELLNKENTNLKHQNIDLQDKLAETEQKLVSLKKEADDQVQAVGQCVYLEEKVQSLKKANQELELHLTRRKRHIDELQGDLKELKLKVLNQERDQGFDSYVSNDTISSQVDAVIQAERRYSDLEQILSSVQRERDQLLQEVAVKENELRALMKERHKLADSLTRQEKESSRLSQRILAAETDLLSLRSGTRNTKTGDSTKDPDVDITQELVSAKVALAEMDEKLIRVRKELHASLTKTMVLTARLSRMEGALKKSNTSSLRRKFTLRRKTTHINLFDLH